MFLNVVEDNLNWEWWQKGVFSISKDLIQEGLHIYILFSLLELWG